MNFIDVTIKEENNKLYAVNNNFKIALSDKLSSIVTDKNYISKEVVLGVRPENIHKETEFIDKNEDSSFDALVDISELMGAEIYC